MYIPEAYRQTDTTYVDSFIEKHPFAILVDQLPSKLWAVHLPLELEIRGGKSFLRGHIAKANPLGQQWKEEREVMAIFQGPHAYISSSWYQKEEVPTWDYLAVHVYGKLKTLSESETLKDLHQLVVRHEAGEENPIDLNSFSAATMRQVKGVIGFEIEVTESQAVSKLSQTRKEDHPEIVKRLESRGDEQSKAIAGCIRDLNKS